MMRCYLSPRADRDWQKITDEIFDDTGDLDRVQAWEDRAMDKIETIGTAPYGYAKRDKVCKGIRVCPFTPFNIYYSINEKGVRVERIVHAARDPLPLLMLC